MASESVPDDWKVANVVPVYKGPSRNVATNYRPMSLTSQLCKVFETVVRDQVIEFLESNELINSQHGTCRLRFRVFAHNPSDSIYQTCYQRYSQADHWLLSSLHV